MANRLLYLARHGESEAANPENGQLTETGRQQSELLGKRLKGIPFAAIHHSPWTRAVQTAAIVAEHLPGIPLHPSDLLQECIPAVPERQRLTPSQADFFDHLPKHRVAAGPAQAAAAIEAYAGPVTEDRRELIISHGNLINWFVTQALDAPDQAWLRMLGYSCALTVIMYFPDRTMLISYNDMGHLPPSMRGTDYHRKRASDGFSATALRTRNQPSSPSSSLYGPLCILHSQARVDSRLSRTRARPGS